MFLNGNWGRVCHHGWDITDAQVVCRELDFPSAISAHCCSHFGRGTRPVMLDNVKCSQTDHVNRLALCAHSGRGSRICRKGADAGVVCQCECKNCSLVRT